MTAQPTVGLFLDSLTAESFCNSIPVEFEDCTKRSGSPSRDPSHPRHLQATPLSPLCLAKPPRCLHQGCVVSLFEVCPQDQYESSEPDMSIAISFASHIFPLIIPTPDNLKIVGALETFLRSLRFWFLQCSFHGPLHTLVFFVKIKIN